MECFGCLPWLCVVPVPVFLRDLCLSFPEPTLSPLSSQTGQDLSPWLVPGGEEAFGEAGVLSWEVLMAFPPSSGSSACLFPLKFPAAAPLRRLSQFKAICAAGSYFRESRSVFRAGMILLVWQIRRRNSCSLLSSATLNPLFLLFQLATVEPGMKFHMYTKEELEEVIKDI